MGIYIIGRRKGLLWTPENRRKTKSLEGNEKTENGTNCNNNNEQKTTFLGCWAVGGLWVFCFPFGFSFVDEISRTINQKTRTGNHSPEGRGEWMRVLEREGEERERCAGLPNVRLWGRETVSKLKEKTRREVQLTGTYEKGGQEKIIFATIQLTQKRIRNRKTTNLSDLKIIKNQTNKSVPRRGRTQTVSVYLAYVYLFRRTQPKVKSI